MSTIQWRPEVNALTKPQSYWPRHIPGTTLGNKELAQKIAQKNPVYTEELALGFLLTMTQVMGEELSNGNQVNVENAFSCHISLNGRLDAIDDPLPPLGESLQVKFYASKQLVAKVCQKAVIERLPVSEKQPFIAKAKDTMLNLEDMLNPNGLLQLTGTGLLFDKNAEGCYCVIEGTRNGAMIQNRVGLISNTSIALMPDIPSQTSPWNNEYTISVSTKYTENGTIRTGTYRRRLRTQLAVELGNNSGILSGNDTSPLVSVTGGALPSGTVWVRIQVLQDVQDGDLRFSLLDMSKNGNAGAEVVVAADGVYTLPGFAGSPLTSLEVTINNYENLLKMVKNTYAGKLVDVLNVQAGT